VIGSIKFSKTGEGFKMTTGISSQSEAAQYVAHYEKCVRDVENVVNEMRANGHMPNAEERAALQRIQQQAHENLAKYTLVQRECDRALQNQDRLDGTFSRIQQLQEEQGSDRVGAVAAGKICAIL